MRRYVFALFILLVACSKEAKDSIAKPEQQSCLASWAGSQYSYFSGDKDFSSNLKNNNCVIASLQSLQSQINQDSISVDELKNFLGKPDTPNEILEKVLQVKSWIAGGSRFQLTKTELEESIRFFQHWDVFLQKTKTKLPIAQWKKGEGSSVYFQESFNGLQKHFDILINQLPGLIEPFDIDLLFSLFPINKESMGLRQREKYFLSLIVLANQQGEELNLKKTARAVFRAIELERSFFYHFNPSWSAVLHSPLNFYRWLKKPKKFFEDCIEENGYLPYEAFSHAAEFVSLEVYQGKISGPVLMSLFKTLVRQLLGGKKEVVYSGVDSSRWSELNHLYEKWMQLEETHPDKNYYYENFVALVSEAIVENYGREKRNHLSLSEFSQLFSDFSLWWDTIDFLKFSATADLVFFDNDMLSSYGNSDLMLSTEEIKNAIFTHSIMKHNNLEQPQDEVISKELFLNLDKNNNGILKLSESVALYERMKSYIKETLGFKEAWGRSQSAYFYLLSEKYWPEQEDISLYYWNKASFKTEISLADLTNIVTNIRAEIRASSSYH